MLFGVTLIFSACQKQEGPTLQRVRRTCVIRATTVVNPPFSIKDPITGIRSGYMIELMDSLASHIGARVHWNEATWGTAVTTLTSHRSDVVAAELYITESRLKVVDFTSPWFYMGYGAIVRKDNARFAGITDVADFDTSECDIIVATGEAADPWVAQHLPHAKIKRIAVESADVTRFALEVLSGRADVAIGGTDVIDLFVKAHANEVVNPFAENPFGLTAAAWAVRKGDDEWRGFLQVHIDLLVEKGVVRMLEAKYGIRVVHK